MKKRIIQLSSGGKSIVLPVNPLKLQIKQGHLNQSAILLNMGEVNLLGHRGLTVIPPFTSFFPSPKSPFYKYADMEPDEYMELFYKWKNGNKTVRFIDSESDTNIATTIENLEKDKHEGDGDLYYTIEFKEYRNLNVSPVQMPTVTKPNGLKDRPDTSTKPNSTTVKSAADTMWALACKYYGDGTKWTKIQAANGGKDPKSLKIGDTLVIPP